MYTLNALKNAVMSGENITKEEALWLYNAPLNELCHAANDIREHFCGVAFDICAVINGKSGRCSENCVYCAQSVSYQTNIQSFPLLSTKEILTQANHNDKRGILRCSIVTSGKASTDSEIDQICKSVRAIKEQAGISVCVSLGLLKEEQLRRLYEAGVTRIHNNLETSRRYFPVICSTHSFEDKIVVLQAAQRTGLTVCSGGLMGLGETPEDRVELALSLRSLGIKSVPVNMLNPIPGTSLENEPHLSCREMRRIVAVFRFLLPAAAIRLAGGRGLLPDKGRSCFLSGANAAISGDMLTTAGISLEDDMQMLQELGYKVMLKDE